MRLRFVAFAIVVLAAVFSAPVHAADYRNEYDKKIKAAQDVGVLGDGLAGDQVNFYTGATTFTATDVSIPGNSGLPVSIGRVYSVEYSHQTAVVKGTVQIPDTVSLVKRAFGDWDLDVPSISTVMTQSAGWILDTNAAAPKADHRCEVVGQVNPFNGLPASGAPPGANKERPALGVYTFDPGEYFHGFTLKTFAGSQTLLAATVTNNEKPTTGGPYHWTTNQDWWVSCINASETDGNGQGFLAIGPDGTKYRFDKLSKRNIDAVTAYDDQSLEGGTSRTYTLYRAEYQMLPSLITDRFGNWVLYTWSTDTFRKLLSIKSGQVGTPTTAPDRTITPTYTGDLISSVTDGTRTWTYLYSSGSLSQVTLPDMSSWKFQSGSGLGFTALNSMLPPVPFCAQPGPPNQVDWNCYGGGEVASSPRYAYVTHPSGAKVEFTFDNHFHFGADASFPIGIKQKKITGPGLIDAIWRYAFAPSKDQTRDGCYAGACPTKLITDQIDPDNGITRRIFGRVTGVDDTLLLGELQGSTDTGTSGGTETIQCGGRWRCDLVGNPSPITANPPVFYSETDYFYVPAATATNYTVRVGSDPLEATIAGGYGFSSERRLPKVKKVTRQQGVDFTWQVDNHSTCTNKDCFDQYGNPTRVLKFSAGGAAGNFSKTETMTYAHDTAQWVVGLPVSTTDVLTGRVIGRTTYNAKMLPYQSFSFEALQQTLDYNADGTLASIADGAGKTTNVGNWKAGIPQLITYPTFKASTPGVRVSESAIVNTIGNLTSTSDELGNTTSYGYDAMGRLSGINYPTGDSVAWNATTRSFTFTTADEYGITGLHWKQVVQTGTGRTTTIYDVRWQPVLSLTEDTALPASKTFVVNRYDNSGRVIFSSYPVGSLGSVADPSLNGVRTSYDALGRVVKTEQDSELSPTVRLTTTAEYLSGFQTRSTNARGKQTTTTYQVFDSPSTDAPLTISSPLGVLTTIARQPSLGKPLSVTRSGSYGGNALSATRRYVYDNNERLCETINPESNATIVAYDPAGNLAWSADGSSSSGLTLTACDNDRGSIVGGTNNRTAVTYDALNRSLVVTPPDGINTTTSTYEDDGALKTLVSDGGTWTYGYNKRRLLETESLNFYSPYTITHTYNANGHLSADTSPDGTVAAYAPNARGQATQAGAYATGASYYPNGALKQFTYGNGIVHTMDQNLRQLPTHSVDAYPAGAPVTKYLDDTYSFDANGNVLSIVDNDGNASNTTRDMSYDDLDRLSVAHGIWGWANYTYDPLDNLRTSSLGASGFTYIYDANNRLDRLDRTGGGAYAYTYDARGNVSSDGRNTYTFTRANRLANITGKDRYQYDGHGRRMVVWRADGTAQVPVYSMSGKLVYTADNNKAGTGTTEIYLAGSVVAESVKSWATGVSVVTYLHTDALGSPVARTNGSRGVEKTTEYAPYGAPINLPVDGVGYTGHVMDMSSGLIYMQQRYYDPQVGRFLSTDPIAADSNHGDNFNRFVYANDNPYRFMDPDGRADWEKFFDSFKAEVAYGPALQAKINAGPVKVEAGLGSMNWGWGATPVDVYAFTEVQGPSASVSIGSHSIGRSPGVERSEIGRGNSAYKETKTEGSWGVGKEKKGIEASAEEPNTLGATAAIVFARVTVSVDANQAIYSLFNDDRTDKEKTDHAPSGDR